MITFELHTTGILQAVKRERLPLLRFARPLWYAFAVCSVVSLYAVVLAFYGPLSPALAMETAMFSLTGLLVFLNLDFFNRYKVQRPALSVSLQEAAKDSSAVNGAEWLSLDACRAAEYALKFCKKRSMQLDSFALLLGLLVEGEKTQSAFLRMGIDPSQAKTDAKNHAAKFHGQKLFSAGPSDSFLATIGTALQMAAERGHSRIGEEEILAALAQYDSFFKQILVAYDLKAEDFQNITLWMDHLEDGLEQRNRFWEYNNLIRQGSLGKDWASGYTITLDEYSTDWRSVVSHWQVRQIIGHAKEIEATEMTLARGHLSNALIVGEPGTGRKSIIEAVAQKCYLGTSLPELNHRRVVELDMIRLSTSVEGLEKLESVLDQVFAEAASAGNVILVIDELHNFVGQDTQKAGAVDVSGVLSKYLAMPSFQFVGITTYAGLHAKIEQNPSFADFFQKIEIAEISEQEAIQVVQTNALEAEYKHGVLITYPAVREMVKLTGRYMPSLPYPKKSLDVLDECVVYAQTLKEKIILPKHVAAVVSKKTEIPVGKMEGEEKKTLLNLEQLIHQHIVNQEEAVREISEAMRRARVGISSKKRPMGSFLFLGPTGVGKTETAKALAQIYFGGEDKMIRLDMSEFQAVADIPRLLGAVSPVEVQGLLTTPVRETPFSLVLLDEIEKAHPNILNLMLQVLDEGHITDGQGRKVMFTNTIVICTSNAGADKIFKQVESGQQLDKDGLLSDLFQQNLFRPEFVNRFDATVIFTPLSKEHLMQIAGLMLGSLQKGLLEKEITFTVTDALKAKIVELSYKPAYGAREMRRVIQDKVEDVIAHALLSDAIKKGDVITVNPETFELKSGVVV